MKWVEPGKASVLVGGQFGSEGKGLAAAWLALQGPAPDIATTNAGAQAGHTTRFKDGTGFVCYHLPTTGVIHKQTLSYINAGSIIDPVALDAEVRACDVNVSKMVIHPRAAVITERNRVAERDPKSSMAKTASTQKGVGHAISDKIMRRSELAENCKNLSDSGYDIDVLYLNGALTVGESVVVEVPQGLDLSLNHGLAYPYTTSRDCWVGSGLSDAGIHPKFLGEVCMVVRTFPIRVGDLYNELGEKLGTSGPFYDDSTELSWEKDFPNVEPERTTVTKRVRRIATWSRKQYEHGLRLNRPTIVFVNFLNYLETSDEFAEFFEVLLDVEHSAGVGPAHVFSFGPCPEDVTTSVITARQWYRNRSF